MKCLSGSLIAGASLESLPEEESDFNGAMTALSRSISSNTGLVNSRCWYRDLSENLLKQPMPWLLILPFNWQPPPTSDFQLHDVTSKKDKVKVSLL